MDRATTNEMVKFVLSSGPNEGAIRDARVIEAWGGEDPDTRAAICAEKHGGTPADALAAHGMRATVQVYLLDGDIPDHMGERWNVTNAEHDPDGKRPGCWFRESTKGGVGDADDEATAGAGETKP